MHYTFFIQNSCCQKWNFPHHTASKAKLESKQNLFITRIKISTTPHAKVTTDADAATSVASPQDGKYCHIPSI